MIKDISVAELGPVAESGECVETEAVSGTGAIVETGAVMDCAQTRRNQRGMVSAEWAVGIIAAVAIAGVLLGIVTSGPIHDALLKFVLMVIQSFSGFLQ
jgi:hypothetical protein